MGRVNETIHNVNTTLRTLLMLVLTGGAGLVGYKAYEIYNEPQKRLADREAELAKTRDSLQQVSADLVARQEEVAKLNEAVAEKAAQIERLEVSRKLLQVRHRLAHLTVLDQRKMPPPDSAQESADTEGEPPSNLMTRIEFVEVNDEGGPIGEAKQFEILGDMVYIDYLRVTFDDKYVEQSDLDRSTAIALFQRIFGEHQEAADGYHLDTVGTRPTAYARGTEMSDFERKIWNDFWLIANDSQQAAELGIHAAHGSAVSMRVQPGKTYEVRLRATGDMTIVPIEKSATPQPGT
jgi:hypothetical protein